MESAAHIAGIIAIFLVAMWMIEGYIDLCREALEDPERRRRNSARRSREFNIEMIKRDMTSWREEDR